MILSPVQISQSYRQVHNLLLSSRFRKTRWLSILSMMMVSVKISWHLTRTTQCLSRLSARWSRTTLPKESISSWPRYCPRESIGTKLPHPKSKLDRWRVQALIRRLCLCLSRIGGMLLKLVLMLTRAILKLRASKRLSASRSSHSFSMHTAYSSYCSRSETMSSLAGSMRSTRSRSKIQSPIK